MISVESWLVLYRFRCQCLHGAESSGCVESEIFGYGFVEFGGVRQPMTDVNEWLEALQKHGYDFRFEHGGMQPNPRIIFEGLAQKEIVFTEDKVYLKYETYDNCSECGSPTNHRTEAKEITLEDIKEGREVDFE